MNARGYVIILRPSIAGGISCIYKRRASRCRPTLERQCQKPQMVGR